MSDPRNTLVLMISDEFRSVAVAAFVALGEGPESFTVPVCGLSELATAETPPTHWLMHYDWISDAKAATRTGMKSGAIPAAAWGEEGNPSLASVTLAMTTGLDCLLSMLSAEQADEYNPPQHVWNWRRAQGNMFLPAPELG